MENKNIEQQYESEILQILRDFRLDFLGLLIELDKKSIEILNDVQDKISTYQNKIKTKNLTN